MGRTACTEPQCLYKGVLYLYLHVSVAAATIIRICSESLRAHEADLEWSFEKLVKGKGDR